MNLSRASLLALAVSASLFAGNASAAQATDNFTVSITVENLCTVTVADMNFGTRNDLTSSFSTTSAGTVDCTGTGAWDVAFSAGTSTDASARTMVNGANTVAYNLYRNAGFTEVLGDGSTAATHKIAGSGDGNFTVHGRTAPNQNPKANGVYNDTITATITF